MAERNLSVDHVTIWRWVQRYAPELNRRCRPELRETNRSWRVDETYCRVAGKWTYLYRAVDSTGATIDFLLSATRDAASAKRFLQKALRSPGHPRPRVINVDGNPSYPRAVTELKASGELGRRCRCRPVRYLNNIVEQDHRAVKRRVRASQGFRAFYSAWRTIQGIETMNMIRTGQVKWLPKDDIAGAGRVRRTPLCTRSPGERACGPPQTCSKLLNSAKFFPTFNGRVRRPTLLQTRLQGRVPGRQCDTIAPWRTCVSRIPQSQQQGQGFVRELYGPAHARRRVLLRRYRVDRLGCPP